MKAINILLAAALGCSVFTPGDSAFAQAWTLSITPPNNWWVSVASSADGSKLWAVSAGTDSSDSGLIYASTNSGLTWTPTTAPSNNIWRCVVSSADGTKLAAAGALSGLNTNTIYTSADSGMTWLPYGPTNIGWNFIASSPDGTKLAGAGLSAGYSPSVGLSLYNSPLYVSTNSGMNWNAANAPSNVTGWSCAASSAGGTKGVAAKLGDSNNNPRLIYTSTNSGS